ncbi:hypothetical protein [Benzoatithermus flavus]|uniref:YMGG-like Gly-zipper domain-containing protein n=1 Tax=Benzoatithermus flavus TaxID=3108223 RepID=A0ABU8XTP0_9PROT
MRASTSVSTGAEPMIARHTLAPRPGGAVSRRRMLMFPITRIALAGALGLALLMPQGLQAQAMIYPNAGQTPEQLNQDRAACQNQATAQSGYNPSQPAAVPAPARPQAGQRLAGAARGAAAGALVEGTTSKSEREIEDPSQAAARAGAMVGGSRQRQGRREARRDTRQQQATPSQQQAAFSQSFTACMTAKGYTVQ